MQFWFLKRTDFLIAWMSSFLWQRIKSQADFQFVKIFGDWINKSAEHPNYTSEARVKSIWANWKSAGRVLSEFTKKNSKLRLNSRKFYSARISDVARIVRARGARCGRKTKFLWSNAGESRNPEKPGFGWWALRTGQKPPDLYKIIWFYTDLYSFIRFYTVLYDFIRIYSVLISFQMKKIIRPAYLQPVQKDLLWANGHI